MIINPLDFCFNLNQIDGFFKALKTKMPLFFTGLGDSLSDNSFYTASGKGHLEILHTQLKMEYGYQQILLLNAGISGDTTLDALNRFAFDMARVRPDFCLLCLGANDANKLSEQEYHDNLLELLRLLKGIGSLVLLRTPNPIMERKPAPPHVYQSDGELRARIEIMRQIAKTENMAFFDLYALWKKLAEAGDLDLANLMYDEVHPNAKGHQLIASQLMPIFKLQGPLYWEK